MSPFPNYPHPERFRTYEDAMDFIKEPNSKLCIPVFIEEDGKARINPEYTNAPYEQKIVWTQVLTKLK